MRGIWLDDGKATLRDDLPEPERAREDDCVIRVAKAGICSTDLAMIAGLYPFEGVMGHEFVGRVETGPAEWVNKRVVGEINVACGGCDRCTAGLEKHCGRRTTLGIHDRDGVFAERVVLPAANLHAVPDSVADEVAVFAEPLAAALEIFARADIRPEHRVLLVGAGKLGQLVARVLARRCPDLTVIVRSPAKAARLEGLGARAVSADEIAGEVFDVAVECTGNEQGLELTLEALRPQGTLVLKSTFPGRARVDLTRIVVEEITIIGSRCGPFDEALALMAEGGLALEALIDARYPVAEGLTALEKSRAPGVLKVLLENH